MHLTPDPHTPDRHAPDSHTPDLPPPSRRRYVSTVWRSLLVAVVGLALVASACTRTPEAQQSFDLLNAERTTRGIPALRLDPQLVTKAHDWAVQMSRANRVSHSRLTDGAGDSWTVIAENVGQAPDVAAANRLFMGSAQHRAAILDRRMTRVGTGAVVAGGRVWVVQVFAG